MLNVVVKMQGVDYFNRVDIDERAPIVVHEERFGDLLIDTIIGKNPKDTIFIIDDRIANRVWIRKLTRK